MQFFFPLYFRLLSASMVQLKKMAKVQPTSWKFLFEGRCEYLQQYFVSRENSIFLQDARKVSTKVSNTVTSSAPSTTLGSDCVLLNILSTPVLDLDICGT